MGADAGSMTADAGGTPKDSQDSAAPDLSGYEKIKFELADIVRFAAAKLSRSNPIYVDFLHFFARLSEDRFNLVVAGRFSRGKTSLMNAILGIDRLPTGIVPLTSVITSVGYGSSELVRIELERGGWPIEIRMDQLPQYITERGNPGNARGIHRALIELPAEILRRGFYFIDTPGLGSSIPENTRTATAFLPEADALVLVSGFDSPLSEDELRVLQTMAKTTVQVFFVLNKQDTLAPEARGEVVEYVRRQLASIFGDIQPPIFSTSAVDGLTAKLTQNSEKLGASGIPELEQSLTRFLMEHRRHHFLMHMFDRAGKLMEALGPNAETSQFTDRIAKLRSGIDGDVVNRHETLEMSGLMASASNPASQVQTCEICERIDARFFEFLCHYQHALVSDPQELARFVEDGGFCARHLWRYAALAAPRDICVSLSPLLMSLSAKLQRQAGEWLAGSSTALRPAPLDEPNCRLCAIQLDIEADAVSDLVERGSPGGSAPMPASTALCVPHLRTFMGRIDNPELICALLADQCRAMDRLAEDMRRYALKHDGLRRSLTSDEERRAAKDALVYAAGRRAVIR